MQLHITLYNDDVFIIPHNYQYQLQSAVYSKLREVGASEFWHDGGFGEKNRFKAFSIGPLMGNYTVEDKKMLFTGNIDFEVRSSAFEFCDMLQRAIEENPRFRLFDTILPVAAALLENYHVHGGRIECYTISPVTEYITLDDGSTRYYSPEEPEFISLLKINYRKKYFAVYGCDAPEIELETTGQYKKVVLSYKGLWITAYKGNFIINGPYKSLELIYNCGLGAKNAQGFGMVRIK